MPTQANSSKSTQSSLLISEIRDNIVIMRDGSMRAVVLASAINFDLMSPQEQSSVEFAYQGFLNSLHFPIQIVVKSQKIDLDGYIESLERLHLEESSPLIAELMDDYIQNIKALIEEANIMDKQFFVVVPYFPQVLPTTTNVFSGLKAMFKPGETISITSEDFATAKTELGQRVQLISSGLAQLGLRAIPLNTQELIDLYYTAYNPDVAANQKLIDASQLQSPIVGKRENPEAQPGGTNGTL